MTRYKPDDERNKLRQHLLLYLKEHKLLDNVVKYSVFNDWEKVVGKELAKHCKPDRIVMNTLILKVAVPAWKTELMFIKPQLIAVIRKRTQNNIKDIKIT